MNLQHIFVALAFIFAAALIYYTSPLRQPLVQEQAEQDQNARLAERICLHRISTGYAQGCI